MDTEQTDVAMIAAITALRGPGRIAERLRYRLFAAHDLACGLPDDTPEPSVSRLVSLGLLEKRPVNFMVGRRCVSAMGIVPTVLGRAVVAQIRLPTKAANGGDA